MFYGLIGGRANTPAVVDSDGHLHTRATTYHPLAVSAWDGHGFYVLAEVTLVAANTLETVLYLENVKAASSGRQKSALVVYGYEYSCDGDVHMETYFRTAYASGGDDARMQSLNRGADPPSTSEILAKSGGTPIVATVNAADEMQSFYPAARTVGEKDFRGSVHLTTGKSFSIHAEGAIGTKVRVTLYCGWQEEPE